MEIKQISTTQEFEEAIRNGVTLIDFNAPWCGPCHAQEPIINKLLEKFFGRATIAEMNIDTNQETAVKLGIKSIPTLAIFKNGAEVNRFVGLQSTQTLTTALEEHL